MDPIRDCVTGERCLMTLLQTNKPFRVSVFPLLYENISDLDIQLSRKAAKASNSLCHIYCLLFNPLKVCLRYIISLLYYNMYLKITNRG